jgi:2-haloalkanoic acid dehalogenase type II
LPKLDDIRAIAFDFHGTLVHWDEEKAIATLGEIIAQQQLTTESRLLWKHFGAGFQGLRDDEYYSRFGDAWVGIFEVACGELGLTGDGKAASAHFTLRLTEAVAYDETGPVLDALKPHYPLAVISNGDDDFVLGSLENNDLTPYFQVVATAEQLRAFKPNPRVFQYIADRLDLPPSEVLFVGDGPLDDVGGARRAGMPVVWLNRNGRKLPPDVPSPDAGIASLSELLSLLPLAERQVDSRER